MEEVKESNLCIGNVYELPGCFVIDPPCAIISGLWREGGDLWAIDIYGEVFNIGCCYIDSYAGFRSDFFPQYRFSIKHLNQLMEVGTALRDLHTNKPGSKWPNR